MEIVMLLLVSAVAQLVSPASVSAQNLHNDLHYINYLVSDFNRGFTEEYFVEDVKDLFLTGCETHFFCKVHDILNHHNKAAEENLKKDITRIVRNLDKYNDHLKSNFTLILNTVRESKETKPITVLLDYVSRCSKRINFNGPITTTTRINPEDFNRINQCV